MTGAAYRRLERQLVAAIVSSRPRVPEAGRLVWRWFVALSDARSFNFGSPNPISFAEIEAFARLHRWPIEPQHVALLTAMDQAWIEKVLAKQDKGAGVLDGNAKATAAAPQSARQPLTAAAFDAMFG